MLKHFRYPDNPTECTPEFLHTIRPSEWLSQHKYDGWRLQIYKSEGVILLPEGEAPAGMTLLSKAGRYISAKAKMSETIIQQLLRLPIPDETVIDAEFVGPRGDHKPRVYIFDCLAWDDQWLSNEPYIDRWARCQELPNNRDICLAETREDGFQAHFDALKQNWIEGGMGMHLTEGVVLKKKSGKLQLDLNGLKKSRCSFKLKYRDIKSERY